MNSSLLPRSDARTRYSLYKKLLMVSLAFTIAFTVPVLAASMVTVTQNGHIRIVNGPNAGLSVTPSFLEYGNVTFGQSANQQITVLNTGSCIENVTASASTSSQAPVIAFIPSLSPGHQQLVNATFDTRQFAGPGDYSFSIIWTAKCL